MTDTMVAVIGKLVAYSKHQAAVRILGQSSVDRKARTCDEHG